MGWRWRYGFVTAPLLCNKRLSGILADAMRDDWNLDSRMRSSEVMSAIAAIYLRSYTNIILQEPGQGRRASRPPSNLGSQFETDVVQPAQAYDSGSQRSNLFPWDNAGASSSISGVAFGAGAASGSDKLSIARADTRLSLTRGRRSSSLGRLGGSVGVPESPLSLIRSGSQFEQEAFEFAG